MSAAPQPEFKSGQHEFTDEHNRTIGGLADAMGAFAGLMKLLGLVFLIVCGLQVYSALHAEKIWAWAPVIGLGAATLFCLALGFWTSGSAHSFRRVVESKNEDVWHLMTALRKLHAMYSLLRTIIYGSLVLAAVGVVVGVIGLIRNG
jgi:hypothetical protein